MCAQRLGGPRRPGSSSSALPARPELWLDDLSHRIARQGVDQLETLRQLVAGHVALTKMADHVVEADLYRSLGAAPLRGDLALAVDYKLDDVFDMDDATKVCIGKDDEILEITKELSSFDAVDTGVFRCSEGLFEALESVYQTEGDASLSQGVKRLAEAGRAHTVDVGEAWWQDVDDVSTRAEAERRLKFGLRRAPEVARVMQRPFNEQLRRVLTQSTRGVSASGVESTSAHVAL